MNGLFGPYGYLIPNKRTVIVWPGNSTVVKPVHRYQPENFAFIDAGLALLT